MSEYDPTKPRSSTNHPPTIRCSVCEEVIKWEDAGSHYILSGYFGCVNKPLSTRKQLEWVRKNLRIKQK